MVTEFTGATLADVEDKISRQEYPAPTILRVEVDYRNE